MLHVNGLTRKNLIVATPMYGGQCTGFYMQGMMTLTSLCTSYGINMRTVVIGDSLITRARNRCVDIFKSICRDPDDKLMFIDSDVQFDAANVLKLMLMELDIVGALYPLKQINWKRVKSIIQKSPDFPAEDLPKAASDYVFNFIVPEGQSGKIEVSEPTEVRDLGTGFMMIKRKVFDAIEQAGLAKSYNPCSNEEIYSGPVVFDHFPCGIDKDLGIDGERNYLSEDWVFCRRWQKLGGKVYACPWMKLSHFGPMGFQGDLATLALSGAKIGEEFCPAQ
jgi:hypothetical protein